MINSYCSAGITVPRLSQAASGFSSGPRLSEVCREVFDPRTQIWPEVFTFTCEPDDRLDVVETVSCVVAAPTKNHAVDSPAVVRVRHKGAEGIRQLNFAALAWLCVFEHVEDLRAQHIAADDGVVRGLGACLG